MAKAVAAQLGCLQLLQALIPAAPDAVAETLLHIKRQLQGSPMQPQVLLPERVCLRCGV